MIHQPKITLLMATYNGESYINQQLDSLIAQTYSNWELIIRDDGSTDDTVNIINSYTDIYKNISLVINKNSEKGACSNFAALFEMAKDDSNTNYIMFCDQDDIWKPEKIDLTIKAMLDMENQFKNQPVLIYGDFELMDAGGNFMSGAFKLKHTVQLRNLLSFNFVYGCTTMLNRQLINSIGNIPLQAINHDYWVALVASIYQSRYLGEKLLRYRQHSNNASGNVAGNSGFVARLRRNVTTPEKEIKNLQTRLKMFLLFYQRHKSQLSAPNKQLLESYLTAFKKNRLSVSFIMLRNGVFRNGFIQTMASFIQVLFFYNKIKIQKR